MISKHKIGQESLKGHNFSSKRSQSQGQHSSAGRAWFEKGQAEVPIKYSWAKQGLNQKRMKLLTRSRIEPRELQNAKAAGAQIQEKNLLSNSRVGEEQRVQWALWVLHLFPHQPLGCQGVRMGVFSWAPYEAPNNVDFKQIARYFPRKKMGLF